MNETSNRLKRIVDEYTSVVKIIDHDAEEQTERSYGGVVRTVKGQLQEYITNELIHIAWKSIGGDEKRLCINKKKIPIPIVKEYIDRIENDEVKQFIYSHVNDYVYNLSVDKHVYIDNQFVIGIECKAYTENAMIKRILVDFHLLKTIYPELSCWLFQLESQLGGDYSELIKNEKGSKPTHTLLSYFDNVDLNIVTLLKGERNIEEPIHKVFKPLRKDRLKYAVDLLSNDLKRFL